MSVAAAVFGGLPSGKPNWYLNSSYKHSGFGSQQQSPFSNSQEGAEGEEGGAGDGPPTYHEKARANATTFGYERLRVTFTETVARISCSGFVTHETMKDSNGDGLDECVFDMDDGFDDGFDDLPELEVTFNETVVHISCVGAVTHEMARENIPTRGARVLSYEAMESLQRARPDMAFGSLQQRSWQKLQRPNTFAS